MKYSFCRKPFTLLELIVVIAVLSLVLAVVVSAFRGESPGRLMASAAVEFETFCARVRFQALENGEDRIVAFDPEKKLFFAAIPANLERDDEIMIQEGNKEDEEEAEKRKVIPESSAETAKLKWKFPDKFQLDEEEIDLSDVNDHGWIEIFRFFPDGGASGTRKFQMEYKNAARSFEISALTGKMVVKEGKENKL